MMITASDFINVRAAQSGRRSRGDFFCRQHDPEAVAARQAAREAKYKAELDEYLAHEDACEFKQEAFDSLYAFLARSAYAPNRPSRADALRLYKRLMRKMPKTMKEALP
jgi:hypothetical protein